MVPLATGFGRQAGIPFAWRDQVEKECRSLAALRNMQLPKIQLWDSSAKNGSELEEVTG